MGSLRASRPTRVRRLLLAALVTAAAATFASPAFATHVTGSSSAVGVAASGSVTLAGTPTASYSFPPGGPGGSNSLASASVPGFLSTGLLGVVAGPLVSVVDPEGTFAAANVNSTSALSGLITAQTISQDCTATPTGQTSTLRFLNLTIVGTPIVAFSGFITTRTELNVSPSLTVILGEQDTSTPGSISATAIRILVLAPGGAVAEEITIASVSCQASAVTAIKLRSFTASRSGNSVVLKWQSPAADVLGFNVYRQVGKARVKVNSGLIRASSGSYRFVDRSPLAKSSSRYWLQAVGLNGSRTWHGPVRAL